MRKFVAITIGKTIGYLTKNLNLGGASAAPGLYALKIDPQLIEKITGKIAKNIIITGTNGKTTTARLLAHFARANGLKVIRNQTGSNLERGIASALIQNISIRSHLKGASVNYDLGIWEVDEAAFNTIAPKIKPDIVIFLNAFRDQLDRYGEVDSVVKKWHATLEKLDKDTLLLVNGDDGNTRKVQAYFKGKSLTFGIKDFKITGEKGKEKNQELDIEAKNIIQKELSCIEFEVRSENVYKVSLPLPGIYNVYNFLAAFAASGKIGLSLDKAISSLKDFLPAFGRFEKITFKPLGFKGKLAEGYIFLIKNPTGATQVFKTVAAQLKPDDTILFALNDNLADGKDVSWIWDGEFERLQETGYRGQVFVSGTRAFDMALRLKYGGFNMKSVVIIEKLEEAFSLATADLQGRLFIFPTYTAMLKLQGILAKSGLKKNYWEEQN